jgi:hypothetical protein
MIFMVIVQHWMIAGLVGVFERRAPVDSLIRVRPLKVGCICL